MAHSRGRDPNRCTRQARLILALRFEDTNGDRTLPSQNAVGSSKPKLFPSLNRFRFLKRPGGDQCAALQFSFPNFNVFNVNVGVIPALAVEQESLMVEFIPGEEKF